MNEFSRYHRQMILPGFGKPKQEALINAAVLVIGAGGLGVPVLQYLVGAGVGKIGIVDGDNVALHNLHRQVLFTENDIGQNKAIAAAHKLSLVNSSLTIQPYDFMLDNNGCIALFEHYDVIVDGSDNFSTRFMVNDACVLLGKPLVFGAVSQFQGQVAVFNVPQSDGTLSANYRHLFPEPPKENEVSNCAEAGVVGMLPGIIGSMMALETLKLITAVGQLATNQLMIYDCLTNQQSVFSIESNNDQVLGIPNTIQDFANTDYNMLCGITGNHEFEISFLPEGHPDTYCLIDVREQNEQPRLAFPNLMQIPLDSLKDHWHELKEVKSVFICQSGKRSLHAVKMLRSIYPEANAYSLAGGVNKLMNTLLNN